MTREAHEDQEFRRKYRMVKIGYIVSASLFVAAMLGFILGIAAGSGATGGIGAIFLVSAIVSIIVTVVFHNLSGVFKEQERRQRQRW